LIEIKYFDYAINSHHEMLWHEWEHHVDASMTYKAPFYGIPLSDHWDQHPEYDNHNKSSWDWHNWLCNTYITPRMWTSAAAIDLPDSPNIPEYLVCGTWGNGSCTGLATDFIGEATLRPAVWEVTNGKTWLEAGVHEDWYLNLAGWYPVDDAVAYAVVYVLSPTSQTVKLWTGSDDGFALWLNGAQQRLTHVHRGCSTDQDVTLLDLRAGWNTLLLKVEQTVGAWGLTARVCDLDGGVVPGVVTATEPSDFGDVPFGHWAFWQISAAKWGGIVSGYPDGSYRPGEAVCRDQMAVYVSRALAGGDANVPDGPGTTTFSDVLTDHWAFKYVEYAVDNGVVTGYWDGSYRPTETVTRDQMAVFIARALVGGDAYVPPGPASAFFPDVPTDFWAFKYVEYIRGEAVTGGYPDGTYRPLEAVTRDQMAVYVQRAFALPM
jgi:hypothetical protein